MAKVKARYIGPVPVLLADNSRVEPGQIIEIEEHELERPDFEEVKADAGSTETRVHRARKANRQGNGGGTE